MPLVFRPGDWGDVGTTLLDAHAGSLDLVVSPNPAVPGQPLQLAWTVSVLGAAPAATSTTATAQILLGSTVLFTSEPTPLEVNATVAHAQLAQGVATINPSPTDAGGRDLYTFGTQTLTLQVALSSEPAGHAPRRTVGFVDIVPEPVDASWWAWVGDGGTGTRTAPWGETYSVEGVLTNRSAFATVTGMVALNESSDSPAVQRGTASLPALAPAASFDLASQAILWNNANNAWISVGGWWVFFTAEAFNYEALFTLADGYGNAYQQTTSRDLTVTVFVPDWKSAAGYSATLASVLAASFVVMALAAAASLFGIVGVPGWLAAAGAATSAAVAAYGIAIDPPEPDFDYAVEVLPPDPPALPADASAQLVAICEPVIHCATALQALTLVSVIDGRIMGATADKESGAVHAQTAARKEMVALAFKEADAAAAALPAAVSEFGKLDTASIQKLTRQVCTSGLPGALKAQCDESLPAAAEQFVLPLLTPERAKACAVAPATIVTGLVSGTVKAVTSSQ